MIESILLTTTPIATFLGQQRLTNATGFFFERDDRLFLVTSRHVLWDAPSEHAPDRIEIELHTDPENVAAFTGFSIPLYRDGKSVWHQAIDSAGEIDVAAIEIDRTALPRPVTLRSFTPQHLLGEHDTVEIGTPTLIVGFPLGFHDQLHHTPVARQAILASSFGLRFQGEGYFLTDGRTHRGSSGAPVVMRLARPGPARRDLPWVLLGVHSARLDVGMRDVDRDEALGLNCAWYADILLTLTQTRRTHVVTDG
ncbi:MAG: serine protease [Gemmatimonadales bacterium]|jgi:S1-C subfamily serine protease